MLEIPERRADQIIGEMIDHWVMYYPDRRPIAGGAPTRWLIRKTGSDSNGGTSASVRSTVSDGVTNGTNTLTSATANWSAADIGHGITIAGTWRLVATVSGAGTLTFSGATIASGSGKTIIIGGSLLTFSKAAASGTIVAANDSVYVGAGSYPETVTNSVATVSWFADVDGFYTGDSGDVILTAYTTNNTTAPSGSTLFNVNANSNVTLTGFTFICGTGSPNGLSGGASAITGLVLTKNTFINFGGGFTIGVIVSAAASGIVFDRNAFIGGISSSTSIQMTHARNSSADYDAGTKITNNYFEHLSAGGSMLQYTNSGAGAFFGGGGLIAFNTFRSGGSVIDSSSATISGLFPTICIGNYFASGAGTTFSAGARASFVEDWNIIDSPANIRSGVTTGPNTIGLRTYAPLHEYFQSYSVGRLQRPYGSPGSGSPLLGAIPNGLTMVAGQFATTVDDSTTGTIAWTNPNNAQSPDGVNFATQVLTASAVGHYLKATNGGFNLPSDATVTQIRVEYIADQTGSGQAVGNLIKLVKGGTIGGNDNSAQITNLTASMVLYSVGTAGDLWGQTWLFSDINSSGFGVAISFKNSSGASSVTAQLDYIRIIVTYTRSAGNQPSEQSIDFTSGPRPAGGNSNLLAAGCFERGNSQVKDSSTFRTVAPAPRLDGPGYFDIKVEVDTSSTQVQVYARYNGSYSGTLPSMSIVNGTEAGVANATATQVGSANTWELLTLTITPTSAGFIYVRFRSQTTAAAGSAWFDDWAAA